MHFRLLNNTILYTIILIFLTNCQLQTTKKNHGIVFLENRFSKVEINKTNVNDVINIFGEPHSKSFNNDKEWIYFERVLTKGKYHKLGQHILKANNALVLNFDKYGVLKSKKIYTKEDIQRITFSNEKTENKLTKKSFIESFLSSVKQKMYSNRK